MNVIEGDQRLQASDHSWDQRPTGGVEVGGLHLGGGFSAGGSANINAGRKRVMYVGRVVDQPMYGPWGCPAAHEQSDFHFK